MLQGSEIFFVLSFFILSCYLRLTDTGKIIKQLSDFYGRKNRKWELFPTSFLKHCFLMCYNNTESVMPGSPCSGSASVSLPSYWRGQKCERACAECNLSLVSFQTASSFSKGGIKYTQLISFSESPSCPCDNACALWYLLKLLARHTDHLLWYLYVPLLCRT